MTKLSLHHILSLVLLFIAKITLSQNDVLFTQYFNNRLMINPAAAGTTKGFEIAAIARFQYVGLSNKISTVQSLSASTRIDKIKGGIGLAVTNDMIGLQRVTQATLSYAYQKDFKKFTLGVGVGVGLINFGLNGPAIVTPDGEYVNGINHRDPILNAAKGQSTSPDFNTGIYFANEKFFASISANHLYTHQKLKGQSSDFIYTHDRNLIATGGYNFKIGRRTYIQPMALLRTNFKTLQLDISTVLTFYDNIMTGIAFRGYEAKTIDALSFFLGTKIKNIQFMYSYDTNISYLSKFNTGSHEVSFIYKMPFKTKQLEGKFYHNARYL